MTNSFTLAALFVAVSTPAFAEPAPKAKLEKRGPIVCQGNDRIVIDNAYVEADGKGFAVWTASNCRLEIRNSRIASKAVAVSTAGSSIVTFTNTVVEAPDNAFFAAGSSMVEISDSELVGKIALVVGGSTMLGLKNSTLRGAKSVGSSAMYFDRGGNRTLKR